ncbi:MULTISPECIES: phosphotransferase family protein [unclassified Pseudonocardia]|uniref:phosphotransferase family protein n=1 Tax=unclassified Pseudonocardia TaxID=2619320 RepID=UPI000492A987|nr:phosphotransferase family protein [Pseudonocardia sp. Ae707_Ps1]OLM09264.1 Enoyl-CoA hydratase [Pseudonocardia sp. Ae707_Ps1]
MNIAATGWTSGALADLEAFLTETGVVRGPVRASPLGDGHSNLTYLVSGADRSVVVRCPPPPPLPPGAHDVLREARLLRGLAGTEVPVPRVLASAVAGEVVEQPFYVMTHVAGPVVTTRTPTALATPTVRRAVGLALVETLAALHAIDTTDAGLQWAGRPEGFNRRHLARMRRLIADDDGAVATGFGEIDGWLTANVPLESGASLLHNDFRLGNVILAPEPPGRVATVLDWELATIGDPLLDVGYFLASWPVHGEELTPTGRLGTAVLERGWPDRSELSARYAELTGRDLGGLRWYTVMALWKLAVLYEYSHRRTVAGQGDPYYSDPCQVRSFLKAARAAMYG